MEQWVAEVSVWASPVPAQVGRSVGHSGPPGSLSANEHHRYPGGNSEGNQKGDGQPQQKGRTRFFSVTKSATLKIWLRYYRSSDVGC